MMQKDELLVMKKRYVLLVISLYLNFLDVDGSGRTSCVCLQQNACKGAAINKYQHLIDEKRQSILGIVCPEDCCTTDKSFSKSADFSWTVELLDEGKQFFCFGTIVHQRVVMTAALCANYNRRIYIRLPLTNDITEVTNKKFHQLGQVALLTVKKPLADINKAIFPEELSSVSWDTCEWEGITINDVCNPNSLCKNRKSNVKFSMGKGVKVSHDEVRQLYDSKQHCLAGNGGPLICKFKNMYVLAGLIVQDSIDCSRWHFNFSVIDTKFIHDWVTAYLSSKHLKVFPTQAYMPDVLQPITTCQSEHATTGEAPSWLLDIISLPNNGISEPVFKCSASLIHRKVALTAASCVFKNSNDVTYYIGTANGRNPIQEIKDYKRMDYIALIVLKEPFDCNAKTCLPKISPLFKWKRCFVLGRQSKDVNWEDITAKKSNKKERCKNNLHCEVKYRNIYPSSIISPGKRWKSVMNRNDGRYTFNTSESPCIANFGSPLMCETEANGYVQSGVVIQNGVECFQWQKEFNVFELSNKTLKWIKDSINRYSSPAPLIPDCIRSDTITKDNEFPWMLAIFKIHGNYKEVGERIEGRKTFLCAATLVSKHVALTARECLSSVTSEDIAAGALIVRAGVWKLNLEVEYGEHQDRHVKDFREFRDYNSLLKINDIALIFWEEPLNLRTVTIQGEVNDLSQTTCLAIGWGHYNLGNETAQQAVLKKVALPVLDVDTCHMRIQASPYLNMTTILPFHLSRFLCAGGEENRDTCHSDRGGPLICPVRKNSNEYFQAGLLSASIGCGLEGIPALYTNVQTFAYDIKESIKNIENGLKKQ